MNVVIWQLKGGGRVRLNHPVYRPGIYMEAMCKKDTYNMVLTRVITDNTGDRLVNFKLVTLLCWDNLW